MNDHKEGSTMATELTMERLFSILRECAGEEEVAGGAAEVAETEFSALGYDSLALLETTARVSREYGVEIPEEDLADVKTPAAFVAAVNTRLSAA
ncbi:actinorhodin polyketide synthase acyl carrier protein [Streptomyces viridiviolaceus]|uniref:Acyl carrier protein n=1 Tax=Streptomyces viridiviolaceus TaxID=68282 RepID=A0ABW2E042_9ACTN|nr:acyl carrier protein [Streptomyces viridiviolaceus]GHB16766.1 actinorhodin polyketide synthase acyl carrier protein [Streptomyces viridiviolaceus]